LFELSNNSTDHLGSLRDVTDANGNLVTEYDYDLWGNRTRIQGTQDFNLGFTGHWVIKDLVLAPFRTYNPYLGRWISRDPLGEKGGINLYGYVGNDPVDGIDTFGLDAQLIVYRTSRISVTSVLVYQHGAYLGGFFGNLGHFADGFQAPKDGTYQLLPKNNYELGDPFVNGTPSITLKGLPPGQVSPGSHPTYRVHPEGISKGCQTAPREWADRVWDLMDSNMHSGGTTIRYITVDAPMAIPVDPPLNRLDASESTSSVEPQRGHRAS
jgi:RHS repeat-associated protein